MSKNPSDRKTDSDCGRRWPKFVSDEDFAGRRVAQYRDVRSSERRRTEPRFVSYDDIVQPRAA